MTGNEYAAETDWSKEQDKGKVSKGRNTKCQNRSIQISSLNDTREKILPDIIANINNSKVCSNGPNVMVRTEGFCSASLN